jgi:hypothetical protein
MGIPKIADLTERAIWWWAGEVIRVDTVGEDRLLYMGAEFPSGIKGQNPTWTRR